MKQNHISISTVALILFCLGGMLASCKVGRHYTRPAMELPDSIWAKQTHLSIGDLNWWEIYTDGPLRNLIEKTLVYNKDLQIDQ